MRARDPPREMSRARAGLSGSSSPARPADHVLNSGAVVFPGVFDQHGCPLVLFPAEAQIKLSQLSPEEVSHFIHYCLRLHSIRGDGELLSVVVDLRQADLLITRFITETLLLLESDRRIIHSVYIVQPRKKDVQKQLSKLLTSRGSKRSRPVLFRRIFLKEVFELSNYIDRSQLPPNLGGYLIYCHHSWVTFVKEMDTFVLAFLSVVSRLPSCLSTLQSLAQIRVPVDLERLREFCCVNEARFQELRRDLGLDDLLKQCVCLLEKLRFPENDPCFQAMAGTVLYTHTALEMLRNYNRITAAVQKVEMLWQQVFSRARVQLQLLRLQREAGQIQEQMEALHRQKLQMFRTEVAKDTHSAAELRLQFEASVYTHAMALVRRSEDVLHTVSESLPVSQRSEPWLRDLRRSKEELSSEVQLQLQILRSVEDYHQAQQRVQSWYECVLSQSLLQELQWSEISSSSHLSSRLHIFLQRNPCPQVEELVKLARLANTVPEPSLQQTGTQLSHRCMTLRRLLTSAGVVPLQDLHLALQWQDEFLKSSISSAKPPSLCSFDSGFDCAGIGHLEARRDFLHGNQDESKPHQENMSGSESEGQPELVLGLQRDNTRIQIIPKITSDSVNLEISVKRSASLPKNPWLSLPIEDLESCYTVTIRSSSPSGFQEPELSPAGNLSSSPRSSSPSGFQEPKLSPAGNLNSSPRSSSPSGFQEPELNPAGNLNSSPRSSSPSGSQEPELNPAGNLLSSTLTDSEEKPVDGDPSLLWDSFNLHNLRPDSYEQ
ncbi:guanine nucleotide exchange factor DBS isoform X2 [Pseudorasbora parva]|uniref:guanine nucleotide exchange factor DBS isoform X2 n=1 Tax=Pseudorasbora parva TaxID=51549 RepID=UPI00351F48D7